MRRREVIALFSATAVWLPDVWAQQPGGTARIGWLAAGARHDPVARLAHEVFRQELRELSALLSRRPSCCAPTR